MNILQALVLSIVEGISEFLPISSTGHLILASDLLQITQTEFVKSFEIFIQLGAICSVVFLYWNVLLHNKKLWPIILIGFIPTGIIGFTVYRWVKDILLGNSAITVYALIIGGIILILLEMFYKEKEHHVGELEKITPKQAFVIGLFQSISIIPGVSRAAATIIGGLCMGIKRKTAVEFSFLLAIPTMAAASGYDLLKTGYSFTSNQYVLLGVGFVASFIVALLAMKFFVSFIQNHTFIPFGVYRIIVGILFLLLVLH